MKSVVFDLELCEFEARDLVPLGILIAIDGGGDVEDCGRLGGSDELDDDLVSEQGLAASILAVMQRST